MLLFCRLLIFFKSVFWNNIRVSNSLDPGQARRCVLAEAVTLLG